jgi:prepilin-type processing-associated H-X9-DG protein
MQFRLSALFLLAVVLWSSLAVFGALYGVANCAMVVVLAICLARGPLPKSLGWFFLLLGVYFLLVVQMTPPLRPPSVQMAYPRREACQDNLKRIALALHNYERANGCFPPAYVGDKKGRPMHSWRVLILPYLEDDSAAKVCKKYNFNEPWDSLHNWRLLTSRPKTYVCPSDRDAANPTASFTSYVAVVGAHAAWSGNKPKKAANLAAPESTIMLVEIGQNRIPWTAPQDFNIDAPPGTSYPETASSSHTSSEPAVRRNERAGAYVAMADGHVSYLRGPLLDSDKAPGLFTIGGCPKKYFLDKPAASRRSPWADGIALTVWLASVGLLLFRAARSRRKLAAAAAEGREGERTADRDLQKTQ